MSPGVISNELNYMYQTRARLLTSLTNGIFTLQNEDGGLGLRTSTMFCTTLSYICMRILGEGPEGGENNACARARKWILDHGTVTAIPSWGKTWLSV